MNEFFDLSYRCTHERSPERLKELEYHLATGDYFPLLSTVMGFLEEAVGEHGNGTLSAVPLEAERIRRMREDLIHLHNHYEIRPKQGSLPCAT